MYLSLSNEKVRKIIFIIKGKACCTFILNRFFFFVTSNIIIFWQIIQIFPMGDWKYNPVSAQDRFRKSLCKTYCIYWPQFGRILSNIKSSIKPHRDKYTQRIVRTTTENYKSTNFQLDFWFIWNYQFTLIYSQKSHLSKMQIYRNSIFIAYSFLCCFHSW